jgi:hypothetical protein
LLRIRRALRLRLFWKLRLLRLAALLRADQAGRRQKHQGEKDRS